MKVKPFQPLGRKVKQPKVKRTKAQKLDKLIKSIQPNKN
jgi:hypothetical protein